MSLGNIFKFEGFNLKDMAKKVAKHPQQLLLGADPLSTAFQNKIFGTHYEPVVDQMGGAYGGHAISAFGNKDGGVYQRANDAGIDTTSGGNAQDAAHVIAAVIAANYALGKLPNTSNGNGFRPPGGNRQQPQQEELAPSQTVVPSVPQQAPITQAALPPQYEVRKDFRLVGRPQGLIGLGYGYGQY